MAAHQKQAEGTINIVMKNMKMLVAVDQPGNQMDKNMYRLNDIIKKGVLESA